MTPLENCIVILVLGALGLIWAIIRPQEETDA